MIYNKALLIKLSLIFLFTIALLTFAFSSLTNIQEKSSNQEVLQYYTQLVSHFQKNRLHHTQVIEYLENLNFKVVDDPHSILRDIDKPIVRKEGLEMIVVNDKYYFHVLTPHFKILFEDMNNSVKKDSTYLIIFGFISLLFVIIFLLIIKNIKDTTRLLNSRQLFLRTVMHELKTPIGKGRIVSELIDDEKQKTRLIDIFEKLNFLIDDFAKVEQILSKNYHSNFQEFTIDEILEQAIDMLLLDKEENKILKEFTSDERLKVDIDLISLAIKNLLDNGIKYSPEHKVTIEHRSNQLLFISKGEKLPKPLKDYFQPFHNETKSKNHGMGLGLYIVFSILSLHKFTLLYSHKNGNNTFSILY